MGTQVLRPQDCLAHRIRLPVASPRRRNGASSFNGNGLISNPRPNNRRPAISKGPSSDDLRFEKVSILRRGESLDPKMRMSRSEASLRTERHGSAYAGSAFAVSPAPSSLPLPSFSKKNQSLDDSATRDLRRLLRLD